MSVTLRMTGRLLGRGLAGFLALLLGVLLFELIQAPVADSLGGPRGLAPILDALPPALRALSRARPELIAISGLAGYLSLGFTHPLYLVLACATIIGFAARSLAGEMERGTIQLALSRPISRSRVYGARVVGLGVIAVALALVGPLGMVLGIWYARPEGEIVYRHFLPVIAGGALLFWAIGGLALLASAAASTSGRVRAWAISGLIASYFVDYFAGIWGFLRPFQFLSVFDYYDPSQALVNGLLPWSDAATLAVVGLVGVLAGQAVFARRDLPT